MLYVIVAAILLLRFLLFFPAAFPVKAAFGRRGEADRNPDAGIRPRKPALRGNSEQSIPRRRRKSGGSVSGGLTEEISSDSPSLTCYAKNGDFGPGGQCVTMDLLVKPRFLFVLRRSLRYQDGRPRKADRQDPADRPQAPATTSSRARSSIFQRRTGANDQRGQDTRDR